MTGAVDGCIICGKYYITFTVVNTYTHGTHTVATIAPGCKVIASCCKIIALLIFVKLFQLVAKSFSVCVEILLQS